MQLLIATSNPGKAAEFREMLQSDTLQCRDLSSYSDAPQVDETGRTFRANACLKAAGYARHFHHWTLADDSGLAVDALEGAPGVLSARWAAMHDAGNGDADNNALLLRQLDKVEETQRTARFVCVLALSNPQGRIILTARGTVAGRILRAPRGSNGFGYDPLFYIDDLGRTTAELSSAEKHAISHRGKALRALRELMTGILLDPPQVAGG